MWCKPRGGVIDGDSGRGAKTWLPSDGRAARHARGREHADHRECRRHGEDAQANAAADAGP
jgi:hypothetical protein